MRPPLPSKEEIKQASATLKHTETKNFITSNAVENILAVPKREEEGVDWLKKPHFGQTPPYLLKIKQEIADEYEYIKSMQQQQQDGENSPRCAPRVPRLADSPSLPTKSAPASSDALCLHLSLPRPLVRPQRVLRGCAS